MVLTDEEKALKYPRKVEGWNVFDTVLVNIVSIPMWQAVSWFLAAIGTFVAGFTGYSAVQALILTVFVFLAVPMWRFFIFETLFESRPYITERNEDYWDKEVYAGRFLFRFIIFWFIVLFACLQQWEFTVTDFVIVSTYDHAVLCVLWIMTDLCFAVYHQFNHVYNYKRHKWHHTLAKPTALQPCEFFGFGVYDATGHVVCFLIASVITYYGMFTYNSHQFWMGCIQWIIAGQIHHGGKDVDANIIVGLEFLRRAAGFKITMPYLHDLHHSETHCNFGMTGFGDVLYGFCAEMPLAELRALNQEKDSKRAKVTVTTTNKTD